MTQAATTTRLASAYGPWALVTGASDGIGAAMARALAAEGLNLVLVARREAILTKTAAELTGGHGIMVRTLPADLSVPDQVRTVLDDVADLDIGLFAPCAGFGTSGPFLDTDVENEREMIDVNCRAVLEMTKHFVPIFVQRGRGGLILMSSIVAFQGAPWAANYAATKAYIQTLADGLQVELQGTGVDVIASAPGPVGSGFAARAGMVMGKTVSADVAASETLRALGRRRLVRPGFLSKFLAWNLNMLPRGLRTRIMSLVMRGMTRHQQKGDAPERRVPA